MKDTVIAVLILVIVVLFIALGAACANVVGAESDLRMEKYRLRQAAWFSAAEHPPEQSDIYIVTVENEWGARFIALAYYSPAAAWYMDGARAEHKVVAWMNAPGKYDG